MKGRKEFTVEESLQLEKLITQKLNASSLEQKSIRNKIRALGFYASDFGIGGGYTVADFRRVVKILGKADSVLQQSNISKAVVTKTATQDLLNTSSRKITLDHSQSVIPQLKTLGFKGFETIENIRRTNYVMLPKERGIYIIFYTADSTKFLSVGTGGAFKGKNPNVSIDELERNWVNNVPILYIGKAGGENGSATIHSRLKQYFRFGEGKPVGHWGGRYIWQLAKADAMIVCWLELPDAIPAQIETALIKEFSAHYGQRPFANLKD